MASPVLQPSNVADELFPDTFGSEGIMLTPLEPGAVARAFEPIALGVSVKSTSPYVESGLVPPLEQVVTTPSGRIVASELTEVPIALVVTPEEPGAHRVTLREIAHNRWWGAATFDAAGEPTQ